MKTFLLDDYISNDSRLALLKSPLAGRALKSPAWSGLTDCPPEALALYWNIRQSSTGIMILLF
jgi:hypothetical protein